MIEIREGTIVRYDDDTETPWLVVYIDDGDSILNTPISSKLVWIRKMTKVGRHIRSVPSYEAQDIIVSMNRLWVA